ncbi:MAG: lactate racemase domain-containing protein [Candidatus Micrarchaeota archaeon]
METKVACGEGEVQLSIPDSTAVQILAPNSPKLDFDVLGSFRKALENPIGKTLGELAKGKKIVLLVQDQTRSIKEKKELGEAILGELGRVKPSSLSVLIATGTHKPNDQKNREIIQMLESLALKYGLSASFQEHDSEQGKRPEEYENNVFVGTTPAGTPVYSNRKHMEADVIVGIESMKMHYFAGYSNMLKLLALPGPSGYETVRINHLLILDPLSSVCSHPFHYKNTDNPIANDMREAYKLIILHQLIDGKMVKLNSPRPVFVLASVTEARGERLGVVWCRAGEAEAVTREGIIVIDQNYTFKADPADILIVGAGPAPQDRHLFYVHNGVDTAKRGLKRGGSILVIAECPEGIGPEGKQTDKFISAMKRPKDQILSYVRENFQIGMQKSYKLAELLGQSNEICVYVSPKSKLDEGELKEMHLSSTRDPQKWLDQKLAENQLASVLIITRGATRTAII